MHLKVMSFVQSLKSAASPTNWVHISFRTADAVGGGSVGTAATVVRKRGKKSSKQWRFVRPLLALLLAIVTFMYMVSDIYHEQWTQCLKSIPGAESAQGRGGGWFLRKGPTSLAGLIAPATTKKMPLSPLRWSTFRDALASRVSDESVIVLAQVDGGFLEMALNFDEISLGRHNITNYLYIGTDHATCATMRRRGLPCYVYREDKAGTHASLFKSQDFLRKMNIRTDMILDALKLGYTVLHTDVDVAYLQNPLRHINCTRCDVAALMDHIDYNAGFIFLRPTNYSMAVYRRMRAIAKKNPKLDDQDQLTTAIQELQKKDKNFVANQLDIKKFLCGLYYFEEGHRTFAGDAPCDDCIVVHNNWIVSKEAKIYRFKELHLWQYDGNRYYSSPQRRYIVYDNPFFFKNLSETQRMERLALQSALAIGYVLNRTVILPKFHCGKEPKDFCALNSLLRLRVFDEVFANRYREHTFLTHPKVPALVKTSAQRQRPFVIVTRTVFEGMPKIVKSNETEKVYPDNKQFGANSREISSWFRSYKAPILRFHSLYGAFWSFSDSKEQSVFIKKLSEGIKTAKYRQL